MKSKIVYVMTAGMAVGMMIGVSQQAMAYGNKKPYFAIISPETPIMQREDRVYRPIETSSSLPVLIEKTNTMSVLVEGVSRPPAMLERTSVARPHHWPFSIGVWP
jgi:hypothetical protein